MDTKSLKLKHLSRRHSPGMQAKEKHAGAEAPAADERWTIGAARDAIPQATPRSVVHWAALNVRLPGSARSENYDPDLTPWMKEPLECAANGARRMTLIAPVQSGKSVVGEIATCFWLATTHGGDIQCNWPNDSAADERWRKRFERILKACPPVMVRVPENRFAWTKGLVTFPHCNLIMQGVFTDRSVASDSIRFQINEEIHDSEGWLPGRLEQAHGRTTAFWNSVIFNLSCASRRGDQLHQAFLAGTQQHWQVKCPGCGQFHRMHAELDKKTGAGLVYDTAGAREESGEVDYKRIAASIRYRFECGQEIVDGISTRRALSLSGCYSAADNPKAAATERSYSLEAVSVDYIPWVELVRQKQLAYRARKLGDPEPWNTYRRERESIFIDPRDRPPAAPLELSSVRVKDREGIPNRLYRFAALDRQAGRQFEGETPHWWLLIMDADTLGNCLLVFEGRLESDGAVIETLRRHEVKPGLCVVDTGHDTQHCYDFCLLNGFTGIKLEGAKTYKHADETRHFWNEPEELWTLARPQKGPTKEDPNLEPQFFLASKQGAFDLLSYQMGSKDRTYTIPGDVSDDFKEHFKAWALTERRVPLTNEIEVVWKKFDERAPDHLFCCASYIALLCDQAELIGVKPLIPGIDVPLVTEP